ncbi:Ribosomal protein S18 acetylase RimI [Paenibacillus algorifonticola]|uniref:Ribosomal protein S18 acetylase RimI n=1 Tax=Paenibacillus algorifonticola TaxID=684063 RepID=A0A1I2FKJ6_9BACL|nr:GNAT family N-acetyltransferase [Paenibacillus algorifonticola]SFF05992.1 Ribosomal protein S18 acetylase RimI [Paenibacillus algorifonticola]
MQHLDQIVPLLERDTLTNITLLKMIEAYEAAIISKLIKGSEPTQWGLLLLLPVEAYPYDQQTYPDADFIAFVAYTEQSLLPELLKAVPAGARLVFKLQKDEYREQLAHYYELEQARAYISYTSQNELTSSNAQQHKGLRNEDVVKQEALAEELLPLLCSNGYTPEELRGYFAVGAYAFVIYREDEAAAGCFIFCNYNEIWEVAGVHTRERWRGQGLARQLVAAALEHLRQGGLRPRYHVLETNAASIRLAESLGLQPFMKLTHHTMQSSVAEER